MATRGKALRALTLLAAAMILGMSVFPQLAVAFWLIATVCILVALGLALGARSQQIK
jgi:hypothetical protein